MLTMAVSAPSSSVMLSCVMRVGASGHRTVWTSGAVHGAAATSVAAGSRTTAFAPSRVNVGWLVSPATAVYVSTRGAPAAGSGAADIGRLGDRWTERRDDADRHDRREFLSQRTSPLSGVPDPCGAEG